MKAKRKSSNSVSGGAFPWTERLETLLLFDDWYAREKPTQMQVLNYFQMVCDLQKKAAVESGLGLENESIGRS